MGNPSVISPLKVAFAFAFSFSLSISLSSSSSSSSSKTPPSISLKSSSSSSPSSSHSFVSDLFSILGAPCDAARVNTREAKEIRSCLRFLVPFTPFSSGKIESRSGRRFIASLHDDRGPDHANQMVWWPPKPVMELSRLAVDSGGDPAEIHRTIDPIVLAVPDVEGAEEDKCQLTSTPYGRRFIDKSI